VDTPWIALTVGFALWLGAFALQLADLGTARFDARRLARGRSTSVRLHPVAWVIPLAALLIVAFGFGILVLATFAINGDVLMILLVVGVLVALIVAGWFTVTDAATRPAADSYRAIRDELIDLSGTRIWQDWLDELRDRLEAIDSQSDRSSPPVAVSTRSAAKWVIRRPQRALAPLLSVIVLVVACVAAAGHPDAPWVIVLATTALIFSAVLAVASAHASLVLLSAVRDAQVKYRVEVVHLLAEAEKSSKKRVAGLGDRVARALEILRQQQS